MILGDERMSSKRKRHLKTSIKVFFFIIIFILIIFFEDIKLVFNEFFDGGNKSLENNYNVFDNISEGTILDRLKILSKQDGRVNDVINHYDDYPEELLDMLSRDIQMLDFVIDYPVEKGNVYSNSVGEVQKGEIPLLLQWDERWGYGKYGNSIIAISGCGPTALSMVAVGLTGDKSITPYKVARISMEKGYYLDGVGTSWSLMVEGASYFGVQSKELSLSKSLVFEALEKGYPIICSMGKGDFTTSGHFIVLVGLEDGKIKVNDPSSKKRSNILWDYERLEYQIKNLWEFY